VYDISQTILFRKWLRRIRDPMSRARLVRRIERLAAGNGGHKGSQERDIDVARSMIERLENDA
jgi:putative component of toxin-antitoxin plasmid stabilization module